MGIIANILSNIFMFGSLVQAYVEKMKLNAACLCCLGWFEVLCITVTVMVGFLYLVKVCLLCVSVIVTLRNFVLYLTSVSNEKFNFGCSLLMYWCGSLVCLLFPSYRNIVSSTICTNIWFYEWIYCYLDKKNMLKGRK